MSGRRQRTILALWAVAALQWIPVHAADAAVPGQAYLTFDGTDDRVHVGKVRLAARITFEAWIKPVSLSSGSPGRA